MIKKVLKKIDSFSREFRLTYKGENCYNSELGGILSVFALLIIILNGFLIGKDIYYKETPNVLNYEEILNFYPTMKVNYKNTFFAYSITDSSNNIFDDKTFLNIIPVFYMGYYNEKGEMKYNETYLEITDCLSEFQRLNLTLPMSEDVMTNLKCMKNFNSVLSGNWAESHISCLTFEVFQCSNISMIPNSNLVNEEDIMNFTNFKNNITNINLLDFNENIDKEERRKFEDLLIQNSFEEKIITEKPICKSLNQIAQKIPDLYFNFFYSSVVVNNKNFKKPMSKKINTDWYILETSMFRTIDYFFNYNIVRTDDGFIFSNDFKDILELDYQKHSSDYKKNSGKETGILWCNIYMSNKLKFSLRDYIKLQTIFANLGGIIKIIMLVFNFFLNDFYVKKMNLKIMNKIFDFDEQNSQYDHGYSIKEKKQLISIENNERKFYIKQPKIIKKMSIKNYENSIYSDKIQNFRSYFSFSPGKNDQFNNPNEIQTKGKMHDNSEMHDIFPICREKNNFVSKKFISERMKKITKIKKTDKVLNNFIDPNRVDSQKYNESINQLNKGKNNDVSSCNEEKIYTELDLEINEILKKKKLSFTNSDIILSIFCKFSKRKGLRLKNHLYKCAEHTLLEFTDYLKTIEIKRNFIKLKYLLLNKEQIRSFSFMTNPNTFQSKMNHEVENYALALDSKFDRKEALNEIVTYFKNKIECENIDNIDKKIFDLLLKNIKNLIISTK